MSDLQQTYYTGSCACGKVQLEAKGEPISQQYCHCKSCRQYHCAPFVACVLFKASDFEIKGGEDQCFKVNNSADCTRLSCSSCRSPVVNIPTHYSQVRGTFPMLFKELEFNPRCHIWWDQRVVKHTLDDLPKYDAWGPMRWQCMVIVWFGCTSAVNAGQEWHIRFFLRVLPICCMVLSCHSVANLYYFTSYIAMHVLYQCLADIVTSL